MQVVPRWRNVLILKNSFIPPPSTHLASFHSTPTSFEKWKNKWNLDVGRGQQPSKNYVKYATRQKRSDAKKALKDLLFNSGSSTISFQGKVPTWNTDGTSSWDAPEADHSDSSDKKGRSKSSTHRASKAHQKRRKRKFRRESSFEDFDEHPETIFQATFGNRCYSWSFKSWEQPSFQSSTTGFEWREHLNWTNSRNKEWETTSETESDDESTVVGSCSDRAILGLHPKGPLKIEDVKNAFRLSALKWHPDRHQGPSQATAEDKFKLCVNAYNSLCNELSSVEL
uniref:J domain-containing protein n=1 Tax=Davidia involucrata TaxID=16924 RepID=A0A5B7C5F7_DAVIN